MISSLSPLTKIYAKKPQSFAGSAVLYRHIHPCLGKDAHPSGFGLSQSLSTLAIHQPPLGATPFVTEGNPGPKRLRFFVCFNQLKERFEGKSKIKTDTLPHRATSSIDCDAVLSSPNLQKTAAKYYKLYIIRLKAP